MISEVNNKLNEEKEELEKESRKKNLSHLVAQTRHQGKKKKITKSYDHFLKHGETN